MLRAILDTCPLPTGTASGAAAVGARRRALHQQPQQAQAVVGPQQQQQQQQQPAQGYSLVHRTTPALLAARLAKDEVSELRGWGNGCMERGWGGSRMTID